MPELGRAALVVTLGLALYALVAGVYAGISHRRRLAQSARNALIAAFGSTLVAAAVLAAGFLRSDFSLTYVAEHSNRSLSGPYKLSAFWGGQEGSLLLWLLILTGYSAVAVWVNRRRARDLVVWVTPVLAAISAGFAFLLVAVASPFAVQAAPIDGAGLNPSLQNPYMMAHPPFLYLGYVGLAVPFAFAMGALLSGRTDERWIVATRRWTLLAWTALGIGQLLGAHWAYVEVGWGGYYAWDPVENAALMPWLAATAFLHSVMIQEKRGMLKVWNMVLVSLAFCLSLFGTFLTRSGIVNSIHSCTRSDIGPVVPRLHRRHGRFRNGGHRLAPPVAAHRTQSSSRCVSREAVFPLQQPAAGRPLPARSCGASPRRSVRGRAGRRSSWDGPTTTSSSGSSDCRCFS